MKNLKKGLAIGVAFTFVGLGLVSPAMAADKLKCDTLKPMSQRIACYVEGKPEVVEATKGITNLDVTDKTIEDAKAAVDKYIARPWKANYDAALEATKNVPAERARLEAKKKKVDGLGKVTEFDKNNVDFAKEAVDAYIKKPYKTSLYEAAVKATETVPAERARLEAKKKKVDGLGKVTEFDKSNAALAKEAVDAYIKRPYKKDLFDAAWKATEKDSTQRARLEEAKKNIEGATSNLNEFDKSEAAKAVDAYIKRPYKKDLFDAAWKATEHDPAQRARLEEAKKNIENATNPGDTKVPEVAPTAEDKPEGVVPADTTETVEATAEKTKETPEAKDQTKKPELAKTGVAVTGLAGLAALSAFAGVAAIRRRRNA